MQLSPTEITYLAGVFDAVNPLSPFVNNKKEPAGSEARTLADKGVLQAGHLTKEAEALLSPLAAPDRCARMVYRDFLNDPDNTPMPTLQNLYDLLCQQTEPEAKRLATALEIYVSGSLNIFNHKTNVDYRNARVVCFDLKKLGAGLRTIAMHIINDLMKSEPFCKYQKLKDKLTDNFKEAND